MPVIGFLDSVLGEPLTVARAGTRSDQRLMAEAGYAEGANVAIDIPLGRRSNTIRMRRHWRPIWSAAPMASCASDRGSANTAQRRSQASREYDHPDRLRNRRRPSRARLVASLTRPGGNCTGVDASSTASLVAKMAGAARASLRPHDSDRPAVDPANPSSAGWHSTRRAGRGTRLGLQIHVRQRQHRGRDRCGLRDASARAAGRGIVVGADPFFASRRDRIVALVARHATPAHLRRSRISSRAGGLHELRNDPPNAIARSASMRPHPQGREAGRPAGRCSRPSSNW